MRAWMLAAALVAVGACSGDGDGSAADADSTDAAPRDFAQRWSAQVEGGVVDLVAGDGLLYATLVDPGEDGEETTTYAIAALGVDDGSERWRTPLTQTGCCPEMDVFPTEAGLLASFDDADGGHLVLLDDASGKVLWDTELEQSTYDLWGQVEPGLAYVSLDESTAAFVDLDDGDVVMDDWDWLVFDDRITVVEDSTMHVGRDPFDTDARTKDIDLAGLHPAAVHRVGSQVVAVDGQELVGIADGREVFRVDAGIGPIADSGVIADHLVVISEDSTVAPVMAVVTVEDDTARITGRAPDNFEVTYSAAAVVQGDALVAGLVDEDPSTDWQEERDDLTLLELGADGVTTRATTKVPASVDLAFSGGRLVAEDGDALLVLSASDLHEVAKISLVGDDAAHAIGSDFIATLNPASDTVALWQ